MGHRLGSRATFRLHSGFLSLKPGKQFEGITGKLILTTMAAAAE